MKKIFLIFGMITCALNVMILHAESSKGHGAWGVIEYEKDITLVISLGVYREEPDKGAIPTFMINKDTSGCYISFGLSMLKKDIPQPLSSKQSDVLRVLNNLVKHSDMFADEELLTGSNGDVQELDLGTSLYARKLIDADTLAAFMLANTGKISAKNKDAVIRFSMEGFEKTMNEVMDKNCG